jgi:membrane protease YdiL (CAAX protease family)
MSRSSIVGNPWIRVMLFILCLVALNIGVSFLATYIPEGATIGEEGETPGLRSVLFALVSVVVALISVFLFRKKIDKKSITSLGLSWKGNGTFAATGLFAGLFFLGCCTLLLFALKYLEFTDLEFDGSSLYVGLGLMVLIAISEELAFRGYVLTTLLPVTNKWVALLVSAVLFALLHMGNPGAGLVPILNVFVAGLLLGVNYIYTRNLWFGIFLHMAWNFFQGPVLGFRVSGVGLKSMLQQKLQGPLMMTGGEFGLEGSLIASAVLLVGALALAWVYERKFVGK